VWKYGRHPVCDRWDYVRKKEEDRKIEETTGQKYNGIVLSVAVNMQYDDVGRNNNALNVALQQKLVRRYCYICITT